MNTRIWVLLAVTAVVYAVPASAQIDLAGDWAVRFHEDEDHRGEGPVLGEYAGLPINAAARQRAETWDASILSQPEQQAKPHPAAYSLRGNLRFRMSKVFDPPTQQLIAYDVAGLYGSADRRIWLDGRPHPPEQAEHTFQGFSTGRWVRDMLVVTTTHMKPAFIQRNGVPLSSRATMTEYFIRHGQYLTMVHFIDDPVYLDEPLVRSQDWVWSPRGEVMPGDRFQPVDELAGKQEGWVPSYPLGTKHPDPVTRLGMPAEAAQGGRETMYPEYLLKLRTMEGAR